jgi:hypothetical protein
LQALWAQSLRAGIARDFADSSTLAAFDATNLSIAYYGDLSNHHRALRGATYDEALDSADLQNTLQALTSLKNAKKFRRASYERLPGRSSLKEFLADISAPVLSTLRLTDLALARHMPEVSAYWNDKEGFTQLARQRVSERLQEALARGDEVLLLAHCLGSVIAYDTLWELSHVQGRQDKLSTWITFGSPLGDEFVKRQLLGAQRTGTERYPTNILNWHNIAAEDDFTCHDETVANDFSHMQDKRMLSRIRDYRIYNLAVRYGKSNPHSFMGYLVHPRMTKLVADWLSA